MTTPTLKINLLFNQLIDVTGYYCIRGVPRGCGKSFRVELKRFCPAFKHYHSGDCNLGSSHKPRTKKKAFKWYRIRTTRNRSVMPCRKMYSLEKTILRPQELPWIDFLNISHEQLTFRLSVYFLIFPSRRPSVLFKGMLLMITFAADKRFGMDDTDRRVSRVKQW